MSNQLSKTDSVSTNFNYFDPVQFETMQRVCQSFVHSELVPEMYRVSDKNTEKKAIANCMIALDIAQRMDANPLMIMQNLVVIQGKPSWSSKFLIATANSCGRFKPIQFKFTERGMIGKVKYTEYVWDNTSRRFKATEKEFDGSSMKDIECVAYTTAKGSDEVLESSPISLTMAIQEGWYTKAGSKWRTMPKQMLMYRAASFWTNVYAPDLSMGMRTVEEVQDIIDIDYTDVTNDRSPIDNEIIIQDEPEPIKEPAKQPQQQSFKLE